MIRKATPVVVLAAALFAHCAFAQDATATDQARPTLRSEAIVTGPVVRIGDLIDHAGIVANVPVFRAPDLGSTGTVTADAVIEAAREHAIVGLDPGGITEVTVTRASRAIPLRDIESRIAAALSAQYALGAPQDIALSFDRELRTLHVEPSAKGEPRIARAGFDARAGRFDVTLDLPGQRTMRLTGRAQVTAEVLTVARPMVRGEIIKQADIVIERRPRADIGADLVVGADHAIGSAARNALQPGRPLRSVDLMKPELVQRSETVTLIYEVPGIVLTVRGRAIDAGAEGDVISVLNEQSKRTVQGVVAGPGRVVVSSGSTRIAANTEPATPAANDIPR